MVTDSATLASTGVVAGTYRSVTTDAKGRVTAGTNPTTVAGYGLLDVYTKTEIGAVGTDYVLVFNAALA
jgi:phage-related tail fiber protein